MTTMLRIPSSTYRLQLHKGFTFDDAAAIVDYLHRFGISDCYASSYLTAVPGSPHGYDVADPTRLNPDLGTEDDYTRWIDALRERGGFERAEDFFALAIEDFADGRAAVAFDFVVQVEKTPAQFVGQGASDGRFAAAHEAHQVNAGGAFELKNHVVLTF